MLLSFTIHYGKSPPLYLKDVNCSSSLVPQEDLQRQVCSNLAMLMLLNGSVIRKTYHHQY